MNRNRRALTRQLTLALVSTFCLSAVLCGAGKKDSALEHLWAGNDQFYACNPGGAIVEYNVALRLNPGIGKGLPKRLAASHFMLSEILAHKKDYSRALAELNQALEMRPQEGYWHFAKALLQAKAGNPSSARVECAKAIQLEEGDPGLKEICKDPGQKITYFFHEDTLGPPSDSFMNLEAVNTDASNPVPSHVPMFKDAWPGSMVSMVVEISADGRADQVQIVKPMGLGLDQKALKILQKVRFKPAMRKGSPVGTRILVSILFGPKCHYGRENPAPGNILSQTN